jgi:hypothetical protein
MRLVINKARSHGESFMLIKRLCLLAGLALIGGNVVADDYEHFEGKPSENLEQAVKNFSEYNNKLEAILGKGELSMQDMGEIHELTYTLENALKRIDEEVDNLEETLESVHVASETGDTDTVQSKGERYLSTSRQLID